MAATTPLSPRLGGGRPWVLFYAGPSLERGPNVWTVWLMFFPRRDLMTRNEEGQLTLAGLHMQMFVRHRDWDGRLIWPQLGWFSRSDAGEIASRNALTPGGGA